MRRSGYFAEVDTAAHGCQHQVTFAHAAQEPVEFLKPLATIGVGLVLIPGLHGLPQLVVAGTGIETAELRGAERDKTVAKPVRDEVVAVDVGPAHHPRSLHGCWRFRLLRARTVGKQLLQRVSSQPLILRSPSFCIELDAFRGQPIMKICNAVGPMQHPIIRNAPIGVEHSVGVGRRGLSTGEEVGHLGRGSPSEIGEILMRGPGTSLDQPESRGDELLDTAQVLLSLLTPLIDLAIAPVQLGKQLIGRRIRIECLNASLGDCPPATLGHPANRRRISTVKVQRGLPAVATAAVPLVLVRRRLDALANRSRDLTRLHRRRGVAKDVQRLPHDKGVPHLSVSQGRPPSERLVSGDEGRVRVAGRESSGTARRFGWPRPSRRRRPGSAPWCGTSRIAARPSRLTIGNVSMM